MRAMMSFQFGDAELHQAHQVSGLGALKTETRVFLIIPSSFFHVLCGIQYLFWSVSCALLSGRMLCPAPKFSLIGTVRG
jgi:hypothetical protein